MKRTLAGLLAVIVLLMCIPLGAVNVSADAGWKDWAQADSRWGSIRLGTYGDNMANIGCAVTAVAKIIVQSGCMSSDECNPGILVNWLNANGGFTGGGEIYWAAPAEMVDNFTYQGIASFDWASSSGCEAQILAFLRQGFHLVLQVPGWGGGSHFIAVETERSLKEGTVYIMDSLSGMANSGVTLASRYSQVGVYVLYEGEGSNSTSELVSEKYNSHCNITITSDKTYVKSMPCSKDTDPDSVDVEIANKGDVYEATMLCQNKWGNLWYQVKAKNGETGYIFADDTRFLDQRLDDVGVDNAVSPTDIKQGNAFSIGGTIYSTHQAITRVQAWVCNTSGTVDYLYGHADNLVTASYNLAGSAVDNMLKFDSLSVGTYKYVVRICVTSYYAADSKTVVTTYYDDLYLDECESIFSVTNSSCNHYFYKYTYDPTCWEGGYTVYECAYCGYEYTDNYTDPQHNYCVTTVQPTCTEGGYTIYTCGNCVYEYIDDYTDPLGHDDIVYTYAPGCETEGYVEHWCRRCGRSNTGDYVDATGHTFWVEEIAGTCQEYGKYIYHCENCTYSYEKTTNVLGEHEYYFTDGYNPTCGKDGMTNFACFTCGDIYTVITPATGAHTYDNDYDADCNVCGDVREVPILPLGVSRIDGVVEVQVWVTVPEWAMEWSLDIYDGFLVNDHTVVTKAGLMSEERLQELVQMLNEQGGLNYTASRLKQNISFRVSCDGDCINATVIDDKNGITVLSLSESVDSCTPLILRDSIRVALGETVYSLGKENFVKIGVVEDWSFRTLGMSDGSLIESVHSIISDALRIQGYHGSPLVDVNGYAVGIKFSGNAGVAIGSRKIMEVLDSLGITYTHFHEHTYDNDCDTCCNTCGELREVADHHYVLESFTDATCDFYGVSVYVCSDCGIYHSEYIPAKGHAYDNDYDADCNVCGAVREVPEMPVVSGDANGDNAINIRDAALLQQFIAGWDATLDMVAADVNGDGSVNIRDVALLQQYIAGWDVTLG